MKRTYYGKLCAALCFLITIAVNAQDPDGFIKRMLFNQNERTNNPSGYAGAVQALGGEDLVSTRLWWDTGGPNF